jgi:hypothetical protein
MQSLGLINARREAHIRVYRTDLEKSAAVKMRVSVYAIRSALAQCKVLRSGSNGDMPFANCVLARLYYILLGIDPDAAKEVAELVRRCVRSWNNALFSSISSHTTFMLSSVLCDFMQSAPT